MFDSAIHGICLRLLFEGHGLTALLLFQEFDRVLAERREQAFGWCEITLTPLVQV